MKFFLFLFTLVTAHIIQAQKTLIFAEDFKNNDKKWAEVTDPLYDMKVTGGKYVFERKTALNQLSKLLLLTPIDPNQPYRIETKIKLVSHKDNSPYTLIWDAKNINNFYGFSIYPDGGAEFIQCKDGKYTSLHRYSQPPALKKTASEIAYTLSVTLSKGHASFTINDVWLSGVRYEGHLTDNVGFLVSNEKKIEVDYVNVYQDQPVIINRKTDLKDIYPRVKDINENIFNTSGSSYLYVGCVDGNCKDGEGTYISVETTGGGTGPEYLFTHLSYWVVKGQFSNNGSYFKGRSYTRYTKVAKKKKNSSWNPGEDWRYDQPEKEMTPIYEGEMALASPNHDSTVKVYWPNGKGIYVQGKESPWSYCGGDFFYGTPLYISIQYKYKKPFASFAGYVGDNYAPLVGTAVYENGDVYSGNFINFKKFGMGKFTSKEGTQVGLWDDDDLIQQQAAYVPDSTLLRNLYASQQWNKQVTMLYNPFYYSSKLLKAGINGRFVGEDGKDKDDKYTGNGIFVQNSKNVYFGSFVNGKPDGYGAYNGGNTKLVFGLFKEGMFMAGGEAWDKPNPDYGRTDLTVKNIKIYPGNDDLINAWKATQAGNKANGIALYTRAANTGNYEAMYQLGNIYYNGDGVEKDVKKGNEWFLQCAVSADYEMVHKIAEAYEYHLRNNAMAADWYKNAAATTSEARAIQECTEKYYHLKYPYLQRGDYMYYSFADEKSVPAEAVYNQLVATRKYDQEVARTLANRPQLETMIIDYSGSYITVTAPDNSTVNGLAITGADVKLGDFIWLGSSFSEAKRQSNGKLICSSGEINVNSSYRVIRGYKPVPYIKTPPPCHVCGGSGVIQGGTLTGGGFVSGHSTYVAPTIVSGVSNVIVTTNYGPPMSIYIPGGKCKTCKGHRGVAKNETVIKYNGVEVRGR